MRAAIYATNSTEQNVAEDAKSVTLQAELARAFAAKQGWTVADGHVYVDDGVSGAEFANRPGLSKLLVAARQKPRPFDILIAMDQDRIGREQTDTQNVLKALIEAGLRVFYYATGQERKFGTATERLVSNVESFGAEWYREQVRIKTRSALRAKAEKGYVAGGKVLGYRNVEERGATSAAMSTARSTRPRPRSCAASSRSAPRGRDC